MKKNYDLLIIGAGAAGLTSAIAFKRKCDGTVLVVDSNADAGRKLLATGNGRCNITNTNADGYEKTKDFFESLGVLFDIEDEGRVYPLNRQALSVRNALYEEAIRLDVEFNFNSVAQSVTKGDNDDFIIEIETNTDEVNRKKITARQVIIATGGKAAPQFKCTGDGYSFARSLGIKVNNISPALTFLTYSPNSKKELGELKGVRAKATASIIYDGSKIASERGEVQFTATAISGICIFDLSRRIKHQMKAREENINFENLTVSLDLAPDYSLKQIQTLLESNTAAGLSGVVNSKLAEFIVKKAAKEASAKKEISSIADASLQNKDVSLPASLASIIKNFEIDISGTGGWKDAQVTFGGVDFSEVDPKRNESHNVPGIYFAGEILDYDGECGGFNLDFAWNSGMIAGKSAGGYCAYYKRNNS